jgi:glycosyltransferase involved in cell wall biosynthesis
LARTLARVPAGAALFVLDAQSTDATADVARGFGARVEVRAWSGYVDARRYALSRVDTAYAFMLDADELLSDRLRDALSQPLAADGYRVRRITLLAGQAVRTAGWSAERIVRCFRPARAHVVARSIGGAADLHERWIVDGQVADLPGMIVHDSYPTVASYHEKFARYTAIEAGPLSRSPRAFAIAGVLLPFRFTWMLARYGGWRDGWRGAFVAWYSALYPLAVQWRVLRTPR